MVSSGLSQQILQDNIVQHHICNQAFELAVLILKLLQALGVGQIHPTILGLQFVKRRRAEPVSAAQFSSRQSRLLLFDRPDNLRLGETAFPLVVCSFRLDKLYITLRELLGGRSRVSAKFPLGEALKYTAKYWAGLCLFLTDGGIEMDNNTVERTIHPIALNRKNALFAGHDAGAANWATIASLVETCKLNAIEPHAYLTATLRAIVNGHKQSQIDDLLPWNYAPKV